MSITQSTAGAGGGEPTAEQLLGYGYAPGSYIVKCKDCGEQPWDLDKRATRCKECATKAWRRNRAIAALASAPPAGQGNGTPAGWKLVPVEPTQAMIGAGGEACQENCDMTMRAASMAYRAMIASAPPAPTPDAGTLPPLTSLKAMVKDRVAEIRAARQSPTPPPGQDLAGQGEPAAWVYEWLDDQGSWNLAYAEERPEADGHTDLCNIRPLYAAPAPSWPADREEIARKWWDRVCPADWKGQWDMWKTADLKLARQLVEETYDDADAILALALRDAPRNGGDGWSTDMAAAPAGVELEVRAGRMAFLARLVMGGSLTEDLKPCDQWRATREGEHPPCWSEGACCASNADEIASLQPTAWRLPSPEDAEALRMGGDR